MLSLYWLFLYLNDGDCGNDAVFVEPRRPLLPFPSNHSHHFVHQLRLTLSMSLAPIVGPADASPSKSVERARQTDASPHSLPPGPETKSDSSSRVALLCVPFDVFVEVRHFLDCPAFTCTTADSSLCSFKQIAAHLEPVDVLALSRSCSTLRSLLLDEKHKVIWIRARKNVDMPGVTSMSEYEAAALAFDKACMVRYRRAQQPE